MIWLLLLSLALIVFCNRYLFLEPNIKLRLPVLIEKMLNYSAPCLLTAICAPIVFFDGSSLRSIPLDPYFIAAIFCVIFALIFKNLLLNLALSLAVFYILIFMF